MSLENIEELIQTKTFYELFDIVPLSLHDKVISIYEEEVENLLKRFPAFQEQFDRNKSLLENYFSFELLEKEFQSDYLFPGDLVKYYSIIDEFVAAHDYTCSYSGAPIFKGSKYLKYKAFLYDYTTKASYVSDPIRFELNTDFDIPKTLHEFEEFCLMINENFEFNMNDVKLTRLRK